MKVAVVILNWNGKNFLEKFLPSLFNGLPEYADLIIADNASTDGSKEAFSRLKAKLENRSKTQYLKWIQLQENYGFTGGYNRAFSIINKEAQYSEDKNHPSVNPYRYYVLINSDIHAPEGWLEPLVSFMNEHPETAACQPKILSYNHYVKGIEQFEYAGAAGGFIDKWGFPFCRGRILSCIEEDKRQYDNPVRCFWASGACMIVRSNVWHQLGGLDEHFFAHMEEIDFCWRASLQGYQIWCVPTSKVYHVGGGTLPNNSPRKLYFNYRNNLLVLWKNLPKKHKSTKIFLRKCIDGLSAVCYIFQGKFSYFKSVLKAHRHYSKLKKEIIVTTPVIKTQEEKLPAVSLDKSTVTQSCNNKKEALPYGMLPYSIIRKFFIGKKKYYQIDIQQKRYSSVS